MKRAIACLLTFFLLSGVLAGCGTAPAAEQRAAGEAQPEQNAQEINGAEAAAPEQAGAFSPDGSVIFEQDGVKVATAGLDTDPTSAENEPIIWLDIENTGDEDAYLGVTNGSVNGFMSDVVLISFYVEDGEYYGGDYEFQITLPAGESGRYALGCYGQNIPGVSTGTLGEIELCFTLAEDEFTWPDYTSEPVVIRTGEPLGEVDISTLGTVVIDDDAMTLVFGDQDYDDWFGPEITIYAENKTESWIGLAPETAEGDGVFCDYIYGGLYAAPGKKAAVAVSFDGELRELKGIENLTLTCLFFEADTRDDLDSYNGKVLDPVTVQYPPQVWGEYENGGLRLEIQPKYNDLITVDTPENDPDGVLFTAAETASREAGGYDGAGWLFSIVKMGEARLHELLCGEMSGMDVFARDGDGNYYIYSHPTDVRFERADAAEMESGIEQWSMLCEWAESIKDALCEQNEGLEYFYRGNSMLDMYLARAAYDADARYTVSGTEYGSVDGDGFDAAPYAETLMDAGYFETEWDEAPDGEYVTLAFPDEDVRFDFFLSEDNLVRAVSGGYEAWYVTWLYDEYITYADIMQGWYYALAEQSGVREPDTALDAFTGAWAEKIDGRGMVTITGTLAPGKAKIEASWPESAAIENIWEMTARLDEDGRLVYENGVWESVEYDENGEGWTTDSSWEESGYFYRSDSGELIWHDESAAHGGDSTFIQ